MLNKINTKTGLVLALFCLLAALSINYFSRYSIDGLRHKAEKHLHAKEERALERLSLMTKMLEKNTPQGLFNLYEGSITELYDNEKIALLVFENDSLRFWSTSRVPIHDYSLSYQEEENGIEHLRNGWYEFFYKRAGKYDALCFILLKSDYDVQNNYLDNSFADWLKLPSSTRIKYPVTHAEHGVKSISGKELFEIEDYETVFHSENSGYFSVALFFLSFLLLLFFASRALLKQELSLIKFVAFSFLLLGLRALMIWLKWPSFLYDNPLFDAITYGNGDSFFNGLLGDILLNVHIFFAWAYVFLKKVKITFKSPLHKYLVISAYLVFLAALALLLNATIKNLVTNSTISFEFSNFFNLNALSFLCLAIVFINGLTIALLAEKFISLLEELGKKRSRIFLVVVTFLYLTSYSFFAGTFFTSLEWFWFPGFLWLSVVLRMRSSDRSVVSAGSRLLLFSVTVTFLFSHYNSLNEEKNLRVLSQQLLDKQDPIAENSFDEIADKIKDDKEISSAMRQLPLSASQTEQYIRQNYFTGYFEKYNISLAVFDSVCMPYFKNSDLNLSNNEFFEDRMKEGIPIRENLSFLETYESNSLYIGKITIDQNTVQKAPYVLYVMLSPKQLANDGSFPDLLLDKSQQNQTQYKGFSYALYKNGKFVSSYGDFEDYPVYYGAQPSFVNLHPEFEHHFYKETDSQVILSTRVKDFKYYFTINSYYFLFFSVLGLLAVLTNSFINKKVSAFFSLNRRIQFFIVSILFFAVLAVGIFSIRLVTKKFEKENKDQLIDKVKRVTNELKPQLFNAQSLEVNSKLYAETVLKKYAFLFNSDISLYNEKGYLFASSQPQLFETGLSSKLTNPSAIANFKRNEASFFSTMENIGSLNYWSLYSALYNSKGKFIGYINLPYFARQNDLEEQLSDYISTLLNIYVVLFLVSLFTGLIVTAYITKPLRIIQDQLARISLGKKNEPISWQSNDEIGRLANEYNLMLLKLEESAQLLAKSEREGAWREMAKQVAHEIKNPLTPMKLNLQYLQKLVSEDPSNFKDKFKSASASIIEQIDTLAHIANEFSNFAKLPKGTRENLDLNEVVKSSIQLFNADENIKMEFIPFLGKAIVSGDKNQMLRVLNNLLKNAIQSIPVGKRGIIKIGINMDGEYLVLSIADNGCGIPDTMREKIFVPNFTTKSTGTGLGLAMVKNIINSMNGDIWFDSTENIGTVFYIKFHKADINKG